MQLLTKAIKDKLEKNAAEGWSDVKPVVKFFNPHSAATWLISELAEDGDTMFGLVDLAMGRPELGYMSLSGFIEINRRRSRLSVIFDNTDIAFSTFGGIQRDESWTADKTLKEYADEARRDGRINA
jgi:hypothetical protein